jgi:hypothetical protein
MMQATCIRLVAAMAFGQGCLFVRCQRVDGLVPSGCRLAPFVPMGVNFGSVEWL